MLSCVLGPREALKIQVQQVEPPVKARGGGLLKCRCVKSEAGGQLGWGPQGEWQDLLGGTRTLVIKHVSGCDLFVSSSDK